ncbi:MAG: hypothetical protein ACTHJY_00280, partial [Rhizobiaceae bacterium]
NIRCAAVSGCRKESPGGRNGGRVADIDRRTDDPIGDRRRPVRLSVRGAAWQAHARAAAIFRNELSTCGFERCLYREQPWWLAMPTNAASMNRQSTDARSSTALEDRLHAMYVDKFDGRMPLARLSSNFSG